MHISEGVLSAPILISGWALTITGTTIGLRSINDDRIPHVAILSAGFFVASLVHVPIGPASTHLILNGLMGILLGWAAFPAILVALLLQAVLFQYGGLTTLGINSLNMAFPALVGYYLYRHCVKSEKPLFSTIASFLCGFSAIFLGALMVSLSLSFSGNHFSALAKMIVAAHLPVMIIEGIITVLCVNFIKRIKPEILEAAHAN